MFGWPKYGFSDLISRFSIQKPLPPSNYNNEVALASISKINFLYKKNFHSNSDLIDQIWENSNDALLRNKIIASFLNLVGSSYSQSLWCTLSGGLDD